jgi:hypothetical protein
MDKSLVAMTVASLVDYSVDNLVALKVANSEIKKVDKLVVTMDAVMVE